MRGRLLSVKEVNSLNPSEKEYYVEFAGILIEHKNDKFKLKCDRFESDEKGNGFDQGCIGLDNKNIKVYEYEEEIIVKEYKTWELLKLAEDYKNEGISTDKRPRYKNNKGIEVIIGTTGGDKGLFTIEGRTYKDFLTNEIWTLVEPKQVEVTFMEAVKALENGKDIRCEILNDTYHYKAEDNFDEALGYTFIDYVYGNPISTKEILEGQWFINN